MKHLTWMVMAGLVMATTAAAQEPPPSGTTERVLIAQQGPAGQGLVNIIDIQKAVTAGGEVHVSVQGRIVKGAPYSADTVTESVQVLADGNRIVHRTTTRVSRDSEGRTRTETLGPQGVQSVMISDPMSGESWTLDPNTRTAFRSGVFVISSKVAGAPGGTTVVASAGSGKSAVSTSHFTVAGEGAQMTLPVPVPAPGVPGGVVGNVVTYKFDGKGEGDVTREDLGQQTIEGLAATGTRITTVLPAGAIGNEQPIRIVSEQWYSPDLQLLLMSKFSDPRSGETSFRLTNVSRAEPDRSLFTVPPDYTVKESAIKHETR